MPSYSPLVFHAANIYLAALSLIFLFSPTISSTALTKAKTEMINQVLDGHNSARKAVGPVGVPPLQWEPLLATYARVYSSNERRKDCKLVHSPGYGFGENLFWGKGSWWTAEDAVAAWVAERQWYHHANNSCNAKDCSHYTQIVWRTTQRVGCSKIICDSGETFIACEYYPPGNYFGQRPY